jgi:hypothetical protein
MITDQDNGTEIAEPAEREMTFDEAEAIVERYIELGNAEISKAQGERERLISEHDQAMTATNARIADLQSRMAKYRPIAMFPGNDPRYTIPSGNARKAKAPKGPKLSPGNVEHLMVPRQKYTLAEIKAMGAGLKPSITLAEAMDEGRVKRTGRGGGSVYVRVK